MKSKKKRKEKYSSLEESEERLWTDLHRGWSQNFQHSLEKDRARGILADVDVTLHETGQKCRGSEASWPVKLGWKNHFSAMETLAQTVMMFPSGSSQAFSLSKSAVDLSSVSNTHLDLIVDGDNAVSSFVVQSKKPERGRAARRRDTGVHFLAGGNVTLRGALERGVVESAGVFANDTWMEQ